MARVRKTGKRLLVFLLGVICTAVIAEGILSAANLINDSFRADANGLYRKFHSDPNLIWIVALGESTTAPMFDRGSRQVDWPFQLERKMNEELQSRGEPNRIKVVNIARSGSSSTFQLGALREVVSELQPDVIVSMLGVNSSTVEHVERSFLYQNSFLVRLIYWSEIAWNCPRCYEIKSFAPEVFEQKSDVTERELAAESAGLKLLSETAIASEEGLSGFIGKLQIVQKQYEDSSALMNVAVANQLFIASRSLKVRDVKPLLEAKLLVAAQKIYLQSYDEMVKRIHPFVKHFCHLQSRQQKQKVCLEAIKRALANGAEVTPQLLAIAARSGAADDPVLSEIFLNVGYRPGKEKLSGRVLEGIYRGLADYVRNNDLIWFAMQYPTGSTEGLKYFLSNTPRTENFHSVFYTTKVHPVDERYRGVFFVSNENFNTLVSHDNETEYYTDYFAREGGLNFGHMTEKGYAVIAQNLSAEMIKNWSAIKDAVTRRRKNGY